MFQRLVISQKSNKEIYKRAGRRVKKRRRFSTLYGRTSNACDTALLGEHILNLW